MFKTLVASVAALFLCAGGLLADEVKGKFVKWDGEKKVLTVAVDGANRDYTLGDGAQILNDKGKPAKQGLAAFTKAKKNAELTLTVETKDGKEAVTAVKLAGKKKDK
jgi:hypothetical protein